MTRLDAKIYACRIKLDLGVQTLSMNDVTWTAMNIVLALRKAVNSRTAMNSRTDAVLALSAVAGLVCSGVAVQRALYATSDHARPSSLAPSGPIRVWLFNTEFCLAQV